METHFNFLVIDDDLINNFICKLTIEQVFGKVNIVTFDIPEKGLAYIQSEYAETKDKTPVIFFLDINMPSMSGWEFLELFDKLSEEIKEHFTIYILSSSVDERDKQRASLNKNVARFLSKPLTQEVVLEVANDAK